MRKPFWIYYYSLIIFFKKENRIVFPKPGKLVKIVKTLTKIIIQ